jgi:hypothetical protein
LNSPKDPDGNSEFDADKVEDFYKGIFSDLCVGQDDNQDLFDFFQKNIPPAKSLVAMRASAFKTAAAFLTDDDETNVSLLRCVNAAVNAFERTCFLYVFERQRPML